ncbi:hypothetical protein DCAR_0832834 [Daucus carota subsp. sativus]|uniref:Matrin-type domain-containing protein n=1 Tax=Daucus carota subsp. sativus TaxID=79200 RepID=A0AAF1BBH1_DAUCS|nr:hypothetical protein DCAR_0832834 [Daucus carota subsp. sativus]
MSATLLEVTRAYHEEVERLERTIVEDLQNDPPCNRDRLHQSHRVRSMIDQISATTYKLIEIYEDDNNARKDEIAALRCQMDHEDNLFYELLKEIREYPRRHRVVDRATDMVESMLEVEFSGEEGSGRYLDLHQLYNDYMNSKFGEPLEYSAYLQVFPQAGKIPRKLKLTRQYKEYLSKVLEYLIGFFQRTEPLQDLETIFSKVKTELEEPWASKGHDPSQHTAIDLDDYSTVEELIEEGPERLKEGLAARGLKTGGTILQRHFLKGEQINDWKEIALMEAKMEKLCDLLHKTIVRTKENVERKQALTYQEMEVEREENEVQAATESDDDDEQPIYNPMKLPMGWDGKPIPYWLYKLHGLGQEFKCEICGNQSYWGRRAYERHFKEWRHQHGMRCLGIPNTKNFNEVTLVEEAKELWERIQERQGVNKWRPDLEEEYEDQEGNIYNKKTYTDLQRQGLI